MRQTTTNDAGVTKIRPPANAAGLHVPDRMSLSCTKDQPFGVSRPMRAKPCGITSIGKKLPPSMVNGNNTKLLSMPATRSVDASDCSNIINRYSPEPDTAIHATASGKFETGKPISSCATVSPNAPTTARMIAAASSLPARHAPNVTAVVVMRPTAPEFRSPHTPTATPPALTTTPTYHTPA